MITDIGINLFDAYYNGAQNYQPGLKPGTDENKAVGIKLEQIMRHLQPLHHNGANNLVLLYHHHDHVTQYPPLKDNQHKITPNETILPIILEE